MLKAECSACKTGLWLQTEPELWHRCDSTGNVLGNGVLQKVIQDNHLAFPIS